LTERNKNPAIRRSLGLEPDGLVSRKDRLKWFGHAEHEER